MLAPDALQTIEDAVATGFGSGKNDRDDDRDRLDLERVRTSTGELKIHRSTVLG